MMQMSIIFSRERDWHNGYNNINREVAYVLYIKYCIIIIVYNARSATHSKNVSLSASASASATMNLRLENTPPMLTVDIEYT